MLATHPIQYQAPLYQELDRRGVVDLEVAFLSGTRGAAGTTIPASASRWPGTSTCSAATARPCWPPTAGRQASLAALGEPVAAPAGTSSSCTVTPIRTSCSRWPHAGPCGLPYLLRGDSHAEPTASGWRRLARHLVAGAVVRGAAGALPIGQRNAAFYNRYGRIPRLLRRRTAWTTTGSAPCRDAARPSRAERLASLGLDGGGRRSSSPGNSSSRSGRSTWSAPSAHCEGKLNLLVLGDGPLRAQVRGYERQLPVRCLGFVNQAELPGWYGCGDILALPSGREPWGLVVNEGMACGLIPVVSEAVGCAADLVDGVGEIFPPATWRRCAAALLRAAAYAGRREDARGQAVRLHRRRTADGYERAALALARKRRLYPVARPPHGLVRAVRPAGRRAKDRRHVHSRIIPGIPASSVAQSEPACTMSGNSRMIRNAPCTLRRRSVTSSRTRSAAAAQEHTGDQRDPAAMPVQVAFRA